MTKLKLWPEISQTRERPETWRVEAVDTDGAVWTAEFWGPCARKMAEEYAAAKYDVAEVP